MIEWKFLRWLSVTSNTSTTPFTGSLELLTTTTSSAVQGGKLPEKTLKRSDVDFAISVYFPLKLF